MFVHLHSAAILPIMSLVAMLPLTKTQRKVSRQVRTIPTLLWISLTSCMGSLNVLMWTKTTQLFLLVQLTIQWSVL